MWPYDIMNSSDSIYISLFDIFYFLKIACRDSASLCHSYVRTVPEKKYVHPEKLDETQ